jgi:hypothetical protein
MNRIRPIRAKVRPGRLKGKALEQLRRECFDRDGYKCHGFRFIGMDEKYGPLYRLCLKPVTWSSGHMAHLRNKRMWGDTLDNVVTKCEECHIQIEHAYGPSGIKPCPPKGNSDEIGR